MSTKALSGKVFLLITGASRGIGKQIAISFGSILEKGSHVLLLATNLDALKETAKGIPASIFVHIVSVDLAKATKDKLYDIITQCLNNEPLNQFDQIIVIHNVGSIGNINQCTNDMTDISIWHDYFNLNVFIPAILNGVIMQIFNESTNTKKIIVNITSLLGIEAKKLLGYYCSGKAAREMFFKVFALENPQVNVINYSPGPVETDMYLEICTKVGDKEIKAQFNDMLTKKRVLTCEQTVNRLLTILKEQKYKSGAHVDYNDEL
ncbi:Sepiapterin reductase [Eufriesea mexicana]|uniref:sepiapterin reductase n=1 Tax=Eufriesea mexicana TaxID=516756 RepID=UPI00083C7D90|nr:PREDICTED: sepiapterin reductase [Eufriesea mexicana]OAD57799.1 Sepiapterin reductase [Eufriesea mexicana]